MSRGRQRVVLVRNAVSLARRYDSELANMDTDPYRAAITGDALVKQAETAIDVVKVRKLTIFVFLNVMQQTVHIARSSVVCDAICCDCV
jgi:hypothetical protein